MLVAYLSFISPLCGVAQTPDCGMLVVYLSFISPLCGVAQTPDCGMATLAFSSWGVIQTLAWPSIFYFGISGGLPPDFSFVFPCIIISMSELHLLICPHASCLHLLYLMFELSCEYFHSTHPRTACSYYLCMRATQTFVADVVIIIISEQDCPLLYYTRVLNVCEYIQTYSLACPWLLSRPDSLLGDKHRGDNLGAYALTFAISRR